MTDPGNAAAYTSFVRYTKPDLKSDFWFNLYVYDPASNSASLATSDGLEAMNVRFTQSGPYRSPNHSPTAITATFCRR